MDYRLITKQDLIEEVVFYGDVYFNEHRSHSQQKIDFDEASQGFIDYDNYIIFKENKTEEVSFEVQK